MKSIKYVFMLSLALFVLHGCGGGSSSSSGSDLAANCGVVIDLFANDNFTDTLDSDDCRMSDLDPVAGDDSFADEYRVTLPSAGTLTINMSSAEIDSFLWLLDRSDTCANGCSASEAAVITTDDDGGGGFDSLISIPLSAGTYLIVATSFSAGETGSYTITTTFF